MTRKQKPIPVKIVHDGPIEMRQHREPDRHHMSVRQIENGWLINEHGYKNGKHFDRERFSPSAPSFVESRGEKPRPKPVRGVNRFTKL